MRRTVFAGLRKRILLVVVHMEVKCNCRRVVHYTCLPLARLTNSYNTNVIE